MSIQSPIIHRRFPGLLTFRTFPPNFSATSITGYDPEVIAQLQQEFQELLAYPSLLQLDEETMKAAERWDKFCHDLFHAYQLNALREVEAE